MIVVIDQTPITFMLRMESTEIVGGLDLGEVCSGGAEFQIRENDGINDDSVEQELKCELQNHLKLECLDFGKNYEGGEPFSQIAKKMKHLLENGKIKKRILTEGYGSEPEEGSKVSIHYNAYVQYEAQPFDSTYVRKNPHCFTIGDREVIPGLDLAVRSMKINEKAQFLIDPELAYRSGGLNRIPSDSIVLFELHLGDVQHVVGESIPKENERDFQYVYPKCLALCVKGKTMFRKKDYQGAIKEYNIGVNMLEDAILSDYDDQIKMEELLVRLYTNLLICCTHAKVPKRGCIFAQKIYQMSKNKTFKISAKIYFNHAKCQRMLGGFEFAENRLLQARALEPNNKEIQMELAELRKERNNYKKHETNLGRALLNS